MVRSARATAADRRPGLLGRTSECELLDQLLANVRQGRSAGLVVRGEAGIGKTALLQYVARRASGFRVARIGGVEAEMELPFAGVHQLCAPIHARLAALPEPQRNALSVALGLSSGDAPGPFLVALAVLSLLSAVAEERPLLCLVDDAQWLDGASDQVLGFIARRLLAESVAIEGVTSIPVAVSGFPEEIYTVPRSWAEKAYPKLIHYNDELEKGGHFAAWEEPELFVSEVRTGLRSLR